ncbi:MAG: universal stress protein [Anaerolineae bacterium]|nr:universal stress protein [Anaerolineae bacterium]MCA9907936.1 universal stress protein [Anaerolineae bacterium]
MYNHILVPMDGSSISEEALLEVRRLLDKGAKITLVTAVDVPELPAHGFDMYGGIVLSDSETQRQMEDWAKGYLENVANTLIGEGFEVKKVVEIGDPAKVIADTATMEHVDAIVMTTHGRSGVSRWLFGSVTNKVLNVSSCPVLVVPSKEKLKLLAGTSAEEFYG